MKFQKDTTIRNMEELYISSKTKNDKWQIESRELCFLYSYLYRFCKKENIDLFNGDVLFEGEMLISLKGLFDTALKEIISDTYTPPNEKEMSKHSTRFERFIYNGRKYTVNYTSSISGRLIYLLFIRTQFISEEIENEKGGIIISAKKSKNFYW
jgi:hypothetical protein